MNEQEQLTVIHSVLWPLLLLVFFVIRKRQTKPSMTAHYIWWFNTQPTWIIYHFDHSSSPKRAKTRG